MALLYLGPVLSGQSYLPLHPLPEREADEFYSVFSALMRKTVGTSDSSTLLIIDHTNGGLVSCLKAPLREEPGRYKEQLDDFIQRNKLFYQLVAKFDIGRPYELVNTVPGLASGRRAKYVSLSAVGFDVARKRAVVYVEDNLMRGVHFLTKVQGTWTVDLQRMPFVCGAIR